MHLLLSRTGLYPLFDKSFQRVRAVVHTVGIDESLDMYDDRSMRCLAYAREGTIPHGFDELAE